MEIYASGDNDFENEEYSGDYETFNYYDWYEEQYGRPAKLRDQYEDHDQGDEFHTVEPRYVSNGGPGTDTCLQTLTDQEAKGIETVIDDIEGQSANITENVLHDMEEVKVL